MPSSPQSRGSCTLCGFVSTRVGMARHLAACPQRRARADYVAQTVPGKGELLYHLQIQNAGRGNFWLQVEVRGAATLYDIDSYLRVIWLECCGHLSRFSIGNRETPEVDMQRRVDAVFPWATELTHLYDFGTTSETHIKLLGQRMGAPLSQRPLFLLARNLMPADGCAECGQPAARLCMECLIEERQWTPLCEQHALAHPHTEEGETVALVNSPRLGLCGYVGPADPPY